MAMDPVWCTFECSAPTSSLSREENSRMHDVSTGYLRCSMPYKQKWTTASSSWEILRPVPTLGKL